MIIRQRITVAAVALVLAALAGCSKAPEQAPPPVATPPAVKQEPPATSREQLAYYSQHLDEARETWRQCREAKATDLTDEIRARCVAAQSAWEMQPYKARGK